MDIIKVITFGIIITVIISLISFYGGYAKNIAELIRIAAVSMMLVFIVSQIGAVYQIIRDLAAKIHMDDTYLKIVLKIIGIAFLAEFGTQICEDAGEKAIGAKIQWAGKVMIFVTATPVILALVNLITDLL